jgi:hypothetical protein
MEERPVQIVAEIDVNVLVARPEGAHVSAFRLWIDEGVSLRSVLGERDSETKLVKLELADVGDHVKAGRVAARAREENDPQDGPSPLHHFARR